tara:strand:+ start:625 stop:1074 length:450 start_codon:yes stop_codon:yes gene_type:complete
MIADIKAAAEASGITAFITNSSQKIETQLNAITRSEDLPIMLVSWDLDATISFDANGFLENPKVKVVALLMTKAENFKDEAEEAAVEMSIVFQTFLVNLNNSLVKYQLNHNEPAITDAGYKLVPKHGAGKHSGILGRFTMKTGVTNCEE